MSGVGYAVGITVGTLLGSGSGIFVDLGQMLGRCVGIDVAILFGRLLADTAGIELWVGFGAGGERSDEPNVGLGEPATSGRELGKIEGKSLAVLWGGDGADA